MMTDCWMCRGSDGGGARDMKPGTALLFWLSGSLFACPSGAVALRMAAAFSYPQHVLAASPRFYRDSLCYGDTP